MIKSTDWIELEKYALAMANAERDVGVAIEQNCSDDFWKSTLEKATEARRDFYSKLYEMRFNYNCC